MGAGAMQTINSALIMLAASLSIGLDLTIKPARGGRVLLGLLMVGAGVSLILWPIRVPMSAGLNSALTIGSSLVAIALALILFTRRSRNEDVAERHDGRS